MSAYAGLGGESPPDTVWVEGVECQGDEGDVGECARSGEWGAVSSDCQDHSHDAGAICAGLFILYSQHQPFSLAIHSLSVIFFPKFSSNLSCCRNFN